MVSWLKIMISSLYSVYILTPSLVCCRYFIEDLLESSSRSKGTHPYSGSKPMGLLPELGFEVNPTVQQMEESKLDLIMPGTESAVLMVEGYCDSSQKTNC